MVGKRIGKRKRLEVKLRWHPEGAPAIEFPLHLYSDVGAGDTLYIDLHAPLVVDGPLPDQPLMLLYKGRWYSLQAIGQP